jgi:hypothetical protein
MVANLPISVSARESWKTAYGTQSQPETEREWLFKSWSFFCSSNGCDGTILYYVKGLCLASSLVLTRLIKRHGGRNDVSSRLLPNWSTTLASRARAIDRVTDRKWAGPTSPRLYTTARDNCWVSKTNCANCHGNMKAREERERKKICSLPGRWLLRVCVQNVHTHVHRQ